MYCSKCGTIIEDAASTCANCGTPAIQVQQSNMSFEDYVRYNEEKDARNRAEQYAISTEEEYLRLKKTFRNCSIIGALIAVTMVSMLFGACFSPESTIDKATAILMMVIGSGFYYCLPFGCVPIINFFRNNGFMVWGWVLILALFFIVLFVACIICVPNYFMMRSKLKKAEEEMHAARDQFQAVAA